jgi:hypothetical protein
MILTMDSLFRWTIEFPMKSQHSFTLNILYGHAKLDTWIYKLMKSSPFIRHLELQCKE